jgi:hypothetical protein
MLNYLRKNHQFFILFIIFYCIAIVIGIAVFETESLSQKIIFGIPLLTDYFDKLLKLNEIVIFSTTFTIIGFLFIGFYIVRISINYIIIQYRTQFPAVFFISVSSFIFFQQLFSTAIIGAVFLLITVDKLISTIEEKDISFRYIDSGILVAVGSFFYINLIFFIPFLWMAQVTLRKFNIREFLFTFTGMLIPFLYLFSMYFLFDKPVLGTLSQIFNEVMVKKEFILTPIFITGICIYAAFLIFASFFAIRKYTTSKIQSRKLYQLLLYLFINVIAVYLFIPSAGIELFLILGIPTSVLFSIYFSECQSNLINDIIFILLLLVPIGVFL